MNMGLLHKYVTLEGGWVTSKRDKTTPGRTYSIEYAKPG